MDGCILASSPSYSPASPISDKFGLFGGLLTKTPRQATTEPSSINAASVGGQLFLDLLPFLKSIDVEFRIFGSCGLISLGGESPQ